MTPIKNLGYRTDAIFNIRDGIIEEHVDYFVIKTPANPGFWFGNFVLFKQAPVTGDLDRWQQIHQQIFGSTLNHVTLGWDDPDPGSIDQFIAVGFKSTNAMVLTMSEYDGSASVNSALEVRRLKNQSEWQAMADLQIIIDQDDFQHRDDDGVFRRTQMAALKNMAEQGHGNWWGAYHEGELVGGMGLYFDQDRTIGRFQYVTTRASHRRQRICTTLLDHVVRHAFATVRPAQLVITTEEDKNNPAIKLYQNFGFREAMRSYALHRSI